MFYKLTSEDFRFVLDNFDNNGVLKTATNAQLEHINRIRNSGQLRYRYGQGYYVLGSLATAIASKKYSEIMRTNVIAISSIR